MRKPTCPPRSVSENNSVERSISNNELHKLPENDFSDTILRIFNKCKETVAEVVSRAQESMKEDMRELPPRVIEIKSMADVIISSIENGLAE